MDFFEKNMGNIQKHREPLYDRMMERLNKETWTYPCDEVEVQIARDGEKIFHVKREGRSVRLNSPYRPRQEAQKWAEQFASGNILINAMLFGLGNGFFAEALLDRLKDDATLFLCEPSVDVLQKALHEMDLEKLIKDPRVLFCFEDINEKDFYNLLRENTHWTNLQTQIVCHHTGYDILFPEAYKEFLILIKKTSQSVKINKDTKAYFSVKAVNNAIQNMEYLRDSSLITDLVGRMPTDVPAIIVSAGPSLDKNIEELKRAKGKSFIICVDAAVKYLLQRSIIPDAVVTLDAVKPFGYMNHPLVKDIPLFCIMECNHRIMEFHEGKKIWFQGWSFLDALLTKYGKKFSPYSPGGSVSTAAFAICVALEFDRIVLIGQDLAFQGNVTHVGGRTFHVLNEEYGIQMIEGIDGNLVKSRHDWILFLDWFEEAIRDLKDKTEVIDATEGGALIHGSILMSLADVIDQYCNREVNCEKILKELEPVFSKEQFLDVQGDIEECLDELDEIDIISKNAEMACEKAVKMLAEGKRNNAFYKLQQKALSATSEISDHLIYELIDLYMSRITDQFLSGIFVVSDDSKQDEIDVYENAQKIYKTIRKAISELKPKLSEVIEKI